MRRRNPPLQSRWCHLSWLVAATLALTSCADEGESPLGGGGLSDLDAMPDGGALPAPDAGGPPAGHTDAHPTEPPDAAGDPDVADPDPRTPEPDAAPRDGADPDVAPSDTVDSDAADPDAADPDAADPDDGGADVAEPDDGGADVAEPDATPPDPNLLDPEPFPASVLDCDAGHEQWARRVIHVLYGRPAHGVREVRLWTIAAEQVGREAALDAMMNSDEYVERWRRVLMDAMQVNRTGDKSLATCYGAALRPADQGELAAFVRDHGPMEVGIGAFNMVDLVRSAIRLDDLSPVYRAQLFAMMPRPVTGANVTLEGMDMARRIDFFEVFQRVWMQRSMDCIGCHNGTWSITGHPDPALDRTWEVPGYFEKALFGQAEGRPALEVASMFRHHQVVQGGSKSRRPWGWDAACGQFAREETLTSDINGVQAYFIEAYGEAGTVWAMERVVRHGYDDLRKDGLDLDPATLEVSGPEAIAYLNSLAVANTVWTQVTGYPLTVAHDFPRNRAQRDTLWVLVDDYIAEGFSLRSLVRGALLDPRFNQLPPEAGCGEQDGYYMRPVYNPWTVEEDLPTLKGNGPGDQIVRRDATWMFRGAASAMHWMQMPEFIGGGFLADMWVGIGKQTRDAEPGFRGVDFQGLLLWEGTYGVCAKGSQLTQGGQDYIDELLALVQGAEPPSAWAESTVLDLVLLLKDRIVNNPTLIEGEAELLEALMGTKLDRKASKQGQLGMRLRRLCGALLESPEFILEGATPTEALGAPAPALVHPEHTHDALCAAAAALWQGTAHTADCTPDGWTLD